MSQYKNMFKKYRRPDRHRDTQLFRQSQNFIVLSNGCFFSLNADSDLESQIHWLLNNRPEESRCSLFTTSDRRQWFKNYTELKKIDANKALLAEIESAAFIVCLDK